MAKLNLLVLALVLTLLAKPGLAQENIQQPTGFAAPVSTGYDNGSGTNVHVSSANPLPTANATVGAKTDVSNCATDATPNTEVGLLKCTVDKLAMAVAALQNVIKTSAVAPQPSVSVPVTGTVTSTACAPTSGACAFATGTARVGPFTGELDGKVRLLIKGGSTFVGYIGTTTGSDCSAVNKLTEAFGLVQADIGGDMDEIADYTPKSGGVKHCLVLTVSAGTLTYALRN